MPIGFGGQDDSATRFWESLRSVDPSAEKWEVNHVGESGLEESTRTRAATVSSCATWASRTLVSFSERPEGEALLVNSLGSRRTLESTPIG